MREASKPRTGAKFRTVFSNAGTGALQAAEHCVLYGIANMPLLRHGIDQPERLCPSRVDRLAGQHQRHRLHRVDQTGKPYRAAETGMQAEHDFRKAKPRTIDCDPGLAGERYLEAAAEAKAMDHRHRRNLQPFKAVDHRMGPADCRLDRRAHRSRRETH